MYKVRDRYFNTIGEAKKFARIHSLTGAWMVVTNTTSGKHLGVFRKGVYYSYKGTKW
jgi:hypothetical protein